MLQRLGEHVSNCLIRAEQAEARSAEATDPILKEDYLELAKHWRTLAQSYQFCESLERFLLDAGQRRAEKQSP